MTMSGLTMPPPIVSATLVPRNAPNRFNIAAIVTAVIGDNTFVETIVAMALAASCAPFV
jgi:hypothetical protein